MMWRDNIHSQLVTCMKVALPLAAIGILSTLFLFSDNFDPGAALPIADIDLRQRALDQGATNASFAGLTRAGHSVSLETAISRPSPDDQNLFMAEDISAKYELTSGTTIDMMSDHAELNVSDNSVVLKGQVTVATTNGYRFSTERLITHFEVVQAESPGPVAGKAPAGELSAGRMILEHDTVTDTSHLLFTDGVKLIYQPNSAKDP